MHKQELWVRLCHIYLVLHIWEGKTGNIITFAQFEERNLLSETCDNSENGDESDYNSIIPTLISKEEMDVMDSGDENEYETMSTGML